MTISYPDDEYVLNFCAPRLARADDSLRSSFLGHLAGDARGRFSEAWRFPLVDRMADSGANLVTFVFFDDPAPAKVELISTASHLHRRVPLRPVADTGYFALSLEVPRGQVHFYRYLVDGELRLDPINPQQARRAGSEPWSRFFTAGCRQPLTFEAWERRLVDRLTDHLLPFRTAEARRWIDENLPDTYRLDRSVGVVNFIDKLLAREEAHRRRDYGICLEIVRDILRLRHPAIDPSQAPRSAFETLYSQMADHAESGNPVPDWDHGRYGAPGFFLALLRRHTLTGAFCHPDYGGNVGGTGWRFLEDRYRGANGETLFDWRRAIEQPLGAAPDYAG